MRRSTQLTVACTVLTALFLTGCSGGGGGGTPGPGGPTAPTSPSSPDPLQVSPPPADHDADVAALERVTLTGNAGTMPFFTFEPPLALTGEVARVADEGTGRTVEPGHAVAVHVASLDAKTETIVASSYEEENGPELILADPSSLPRSLFDVLVGAKVGSRVLFGAPVDGVTTIYSFEILATAPIFEHAEGETVEPRSGVPGVAFADGSVPTMTPVEVDPPTTQVTQPLVVGEGDLIGPESWLVVRYSTWLWDGTALESTWETGRPEVVRLTDTVAAWQEGLAGQAIGSRVLLVAPPGQAYGDEATQSVPAGSTLVYVVDILGGM